MCIKGPSCAKHCSGGWKLSSEQTDTNSDLMELTF